MSVTATGFITDAVLSAAIKDVIQRAAGAPGTGIGGKGAAGDLQGFWTSIVTRANQAAYQEIVGRLAERGFNPVTQIFNWDRGVEFQTAIGVWWCLVHNAALQTDSYQAQALLEDHKQLDRRWELKDCAVMINNVWTNPQGPVGQAISGANDLTCGYTPEPPQWCDRDDGPPKAVWGGL